MTWDACVDGMDGVDGVDGVDNISNGAVRWYHSPAVHGPFCSPTMASNTGVPHTTVLYSWKFVCMYKTEPVSVCVR